MKKRLRNRFMLMLIVLTALCAAGHARAENCPVQLAEEALLVNAAGEDVIAAGEYSLLYELYGLPEGLTLYAGAKAGDDLNYALVDADGQRITEFEYSMLEYMGDGILFGQGEKCGVMNADGQVIIGPEYTWLISNGEGGYLALRTDPYDDSPDSVYRVSADGTAETSGVMIGYGPYAMSDGLSAATDPDSGLYGYIGADGRWAIQPAFDWAGIFMDGHAQVDVSGRTGLIDRTGRWVIEPGYDVIQQAGRDGLILANAGETMELIHPRTLETISEYTSCIYGYPACDGGAVLLMDGYAVLTDRTGAETARLEGCLDVSQWEGMENELIAQMGEYGTPSAYLYSNDGTVLAGPYQNIMLLGEADGQMYYTFVDFESEQVEYEQYNLTFWDEIPGTRRCGVLTADGTELCSFECEYISQAGEDRMLIQKDEAIVLADFSGRVIREFENIYGEEAEE